MQRVALSYVVILLMSIENAREHVSNSSGVYHEKGEMFFVFVLSSLPGSN